MKVNDEIYFAEYERGKGYSELQKSLVTKVGTKFFETSTSSRKILLSEMIDSNSSSDDHKRYFSNHQHHAEYFELIEIKRKIRKFAEGQMNIDIDDLRTIVSLIS